MPSQLALLAPRFFDAGISPVTGVATMGLIDKDKQVKDTIGRRAILAGIGAISPIAIGLALRKMTPTIRKHLTYPTMGAMSIAGGVAGYTAIPVVNRYISDRALGDKESADKEIIDRGSKTLAYSKTVQQAADKSFDWMPKSASVGSAFGKIVKDSVGAIGGAGAWAGKSYLRGMHGVKNPNFFEGAGTFALRAGTVGAVGYGGMQAHKYMTRPRSGQNYTTYLRNQMLSGGIQPHQVDSQDLTKVRDLGMR